MKAKRIQAGQQFGQLTALEKTNERKNGYAVWQCRCSCGNEVLASSRFLKNGWIKDCGCMPKEKKYQDLTGKRFGRLLVLEEMQERNPGGKVMWKCRCDCGTEVITSSGQLTGGYKKSCGCLGKISPKDWIGRRFGDLEVISYASKKAGKHYWRCRCLCGCEREFDVRQSSLKSGQTKSCVNRRQRGLPDIIGQKFGDLTVTAYDGRNRGNHFWSCVCSCGNQVSINQFSLLSGHTKSCGCRANPVKNLHFIEGTCIESIRNRKTAVNNTSGIRGVYQDRRTGKWAAQITFKGKTTYLGVYDTIEEAAKARRQAEKVFDEFLDLYDSGKIQQSE